MVTSETAVASEVEIYLADAANLIRKERKSCQGEDVPVKKNLMIAVAVNQYAAANQ